MNYVLSDRCEVLWVYQADQRPAVVMPATGPKLVDINHSTATEIQL